MGLKLKRYLRQTLVYWAKTDKPDRFGRPQYLQPAEFRCRWDDKAEEVMLPGDRKILSDAVILMAPAVIDGVKVAPVKEGGIVMETTLTLIKRLITYPTMPTPQQGAREIMKVTHNPDRKGRKFLFTIYT